MNPTLSQYLSDYYDAVVLHRGQMDMVIEGLRYDILDDPELATAAREELARIDALDAACGGYLAERDFVSSIHRKILREALS